MKFIPKDKQVLAAIIIGFLLRILPLIIWVKWPCTRDECTYLRLSDRILSGQGMTASNGWIWAPGYPYLVAIHQYLFGFGAAIKVTQSILAMGIVYLMSRVGKLFFNKQVGRVAAWLYALSPTQIFFAQSLWSECLYGGLLLLSVFYFEHCRRNSASQKYAVMVGVFVGVCVLFRGVATYMIPIFIFALLWKRWFERKVWFQIVSLVLAVMLVVTPYSLYASKKFGATMISDRTLGQMMWLGNNTFQPVTFDWGNGQLSGREFVRHTKPGRKHCAPKRKPIKRDKCHVKEGVAWISNNPQEFLKRMPLRIAQMLNPHTFITRHIRWGNWLGIPRFFDELIILVNALWSFVVIWIGSLGLVVHGKKGRTVLVVGILLYHVAAISLLAGLSRYRVPLEPLLMLYAANLLVQGHRTGYYVLMEEKWRLLLSIIVALTVFPLTLWFLPVGWVWWEQW